MFVIMFVFCVAVIEGGIGQAVPEHPKREYILALSTAFGDAYLFQVKPLGVLWRSSVWCTEEMGQFLTETDPPFFLAK